MVLVKCSSKLTYSPLPNAISLLFEPSSFSMAVTHIDSSLSLFPSLQSFSSPQLKPQTVIPPPSSSSSFLVVKQDRQDPGAERVIFIVAGPCRGDSRVLMRFYILQKNSHFVKVPVFSNQKGITVDSNFGVLLDVDHGVSIQVVGSVNFFVIYSLSSKKLWIFAVKLIPGNSKSDNADDKLKLMRCAVIACYSPVWSISTSFEHLILGESGGVRVFNLRHLVKGKFMQVTASTSELMGNASNRGSNLPNGIAGDNKCYKPSKELPLSDGRLDEKSEKCVVLTKQKSVKCRQDPAEYGACFLKFRGSDGPDTKSTKAKAISIRALTPKAFIILDSLGDMYILDLIGPTNGSATNHLRHVAYEMRVEKIAVLPDVLSKTHTVWVSDGSHSVHKLSVSANGIQGNKLDEDDVLNDFTRITVVSAIFTSERVLDLVPLASGVVSILGKGNIYVYSTP